MGPPAPRPQAAPKQPDPVRIPSPDDPELMLDQRRRRQQEMASRQGRESTVLSSDTPSYNRTTLG